MTAIIVFLKYPEAGKVKTRLAREVGPRRALEVYEALLAYTVKEIAALDRKKFPLIAYCDPYRSLEDYQALLDTFPGRITLQHGAELGERLSSAAFKESGAHEKVLIMGTDCPSLKTQHVLEADRLLSRKDCDLVVGPTVDGGYYLIGMKRFVPELFEEMPWSTDRVSQLTLEKAKALGLKCESLEVLMDIDTAEDLTKSGFVT